MPACVGAVALALCTVAVAPEAGGEPAELQRQRCPKPSEFANVFSFGYAGDRMPKDDAKFGELLQKLQAGGFNTIHCVYTEARLALCRKHGVQMMVDLLAPGHHVYKDVEAVKALCGKLRGEAAVWGYNIWNDNIGKTGRGRRRDINNIRQWDPTHPAFCGTYRTYGMRHLTNADILGYYDYHWRRGPHYHFPHLLRYWQWARERNACVYRWVWCESGIPGRGNYNRSLYTVTTSIACGLKGVIWFIGQRMMNPATLEWTTTGRDIIKVNQQVMPLRRELMRLANPVAVYSTPITKTNKDRALPDGKAAMMPPGLEANAFPKDFWVQPTSGEFVLGLFQDEQQRAALFVANHNAYAEQTVTLRVRRPERLSLFDRREGCWQALALRDGAVSFALAPAGGELLRLGAASPPGVLPSRSPRSTTSSRPRGASAPSSAPSGPAMRGQTARSRPSASR